MYTIRAYDIGGRTKALTFHGDDHGRLWVFRGEIPSTLPTVATPYGGPASTFMERLTAALRSADLWGNDGDLVAYSICGPVVGTTCLELINRDVREPFTVEADAVGNDGMMATVGSLIAGTARGHQGGLVCLTLGTGIGMGSFHYDGNTRVMNDGEVHFTIRGSTAVCNCHRRGCFEATASVGALTSSALDAGWQTEDDTVDVGREFEKILKDPAAGHHQAIKGAVYRWHLVLAEGLANLFVTLKVGGNMTQPPALFVLAGGLSALVNPDQLRQQILDEFGGKPFLGSNIVVRRETLGNAAGCVGAAALALANDLDRPVTEIQFLDTPPT